MVPEEKAVGSFVLRVTIAVLYLLVALLIFRIYVSPDTLDVPVINTIFFVLGVALLLAAQGSRGLVRGALNGLALAMGLCILLYSFCAGANWLTFIWLLFAMLCVGALLGVQMNDDDAARS